MKVTAVFGPNVGHSPAVFKAMFKQLWSYLFRLLEFGRNLDFWTASLIKVKVEKNTALAQHMMIGSNGWAAD